MPKTPIECDGVLAARLKADLADETVISQEAHQTRRYLYHGLAVAQGKRREVMRMETEIAWHDEVDAILAEGAPLVPDSWQALGAHTDEPGVRGNAHGDHRG